MSIARISTLMYHDVLADTELLSSSGFNTPGADLYKLHTSSFAAHLNKLKESEKCHVTTIHESLNSGDNGGKIPCLLTFDDGGSSAFDLTAPALEQHGWRGHFFITTDFIGKPGFLDATQIRSLHNKGHIIGAHSASHPDRISALPEDQILEEWRRSTQTLEKIIGSPTNTASIPGGFISPQVVKAADQAGIHHLFTSEPNARVSSHHNLKLHGRYTIKNKTPAMTALQLACLNSITTNSQVLSWKSRRLLKTLLGPVYLKIRAKILSD